MPLESSLRQAIDPHQRETFTEHIAITLGPAHVPKKQRLTAGVEKQQKEVQHPLSFHTFKQRIRLFLNGPRTRVCNLYPDMNQLIRSTDCTFDVKHKLDS